MGVVVFSLSLLLFGCSTDTTKEDREGVVVATTGQIADAIKAISGGHLQVSALMGPGVDPHLYKATQSDLSKLDKAEVIFL